MQGRTLPALAAFAEDVARALQGTSRLLDTGPYPSAAIAFGDRHPLLIRDHGHSLALSLPTDGSWSVQSEEELRAVVPAIHSLLVRAPQPFSIADATLVLLPVLAGITRSDWCLSFPGTPLPSEAWLREGARHVGLFQHPGGVLLVVWVGSSMRQQRVKAAAEVAALAPWLVQTLEEQRLAREAEELEKQRKAALPLPDYDQVLAALRSGVRIIAGGGRFSNEFYWDTCLRCIAFDEGLTTEYDASEEDLRRSIEHHPEAFREALEKK